MTLTANVFPQFDLKAYTAGVNVSSDAFKVLLFASGYTFASTQTTMTAVKSGATEASGTGYTTGGVTLAGESCTLSAFVLTLTWSTNPSWTTSTISATDAIFYDSQGGTDATNIPLVHWGFGGTVSTTAGTFLLTISGSGLKTVTGS